jgi:hypothetical protein
MNNRGFYPSSFDTAHSGYMSQQEIQRREAGNAAFRRQMEEELEAKERAKETLAKELPTLEENIRKATQELNEALTLRNEGKKQGILHQKNVNNALYTQLYYLNPSVKRSKEGYNRSEKIIMNLEKLTGDKYLENAGRFTFKSKRVNNAIPKARAGLQAFYNKKMQSQKPNRNKYYSKNINELQQKLNELLMKKGRLILAAQSKGGKSKTRSRKGTKKNMTRRR